MTEIPTARHGFHFAIVVSVIALTGCAGSRGISDSDPIAGEEPIRQDDSHTRLVMSMSGWLDTPYRYGGSLKSGVDCSAYVRAMMNSAFDSNLPRTTREQMAVGVEVERNRIQPGDLVFFQTGRNQYHVGIYLDEGEFTHASTTSGVTVSHLEDYYWKDKYLMTRRVLPDIENFAVRDSAKTPPTVAQNRPARSKTESKPVARTGSGTWTSSGDSSTGDKPARTGW